MELEGIGKMERERMGETAGEKEKRAFFGFDLI